MTDERNRRRADGLDAPSSTCGDGAGQSLLDRRRPASPARPSRSSARQVAERAVEQEHATAVHGRPADRRRRRAGRRRRRAPVSTSSSSTSPSRTYGRGLLARAGSPALGRAEGDVEQSRLGQRELDVRPAGLAQPLPRALCRVGLASRASEPVAAWPGPSWSLARRARSRRAACRGRRSGGRPRCARRRYAGRPRAARRRPAPRPRASSARGVDERGAQVAVVVRLRGGGHGAIIPSMLTVVTFRGTVMLSLSTCRGSRERSIPRSRKSRRPRSRSARPSRHQPRHHDRQRRTADASPRDLDAGTRRPAVDRRRATTSPSLPSCSPPGACPTATAGGRR